MNEKITIKSSSRSGRFKKKLVSESFLKLEAPVIEAKIAPLLDLYSQNKITQSEFCTLYIITILGHRYPKHWLGARKIPMNLNHNLNFPISEIPLEFEKNVSSRLQNIKTLGDLLNNFSLKSTPETVNRSLLLWSQGCYGLILMFHVPSPNEVLEQQKRGQRCVTTLIKRKEIEKYILGERDSLSFTMHDLIHADHFYHQNDCYQGQLGFYGLLSHCLLEGHYDDLLKNMAFKEEFEYVIADMNAYAIHLLKCFKSALIHYHENGEKFFSEWTHKLNLEEGEREAILKLNGGNYSPAIHDPILLKFLDKWRVTL